MVGPQVINNGAFRQEATVTFTGVKAAAINGSVRADVLTGAFAEIENNLEEPHNVSALQPCCIRCLLLLCGLKGRG